MHASQSGVATATFQPIQRVRLHPRNLSCTAFLRIIIARKKPALFEGTKSALIEGKSAKFEDCNPLSIHPHTHTYTHSLARSLTCSLTSRYTEHDAVLLEIHTRTMGSSISKNKKTRSQSASASQPPKSNTQAQVTSKDKAILDLKNARDRLKKYQARLDIEAQQLHESAKKLLQAEKRVRCIDNTIGESGGRLLG